MATIKETAEEVAAVAEETGEVGLAHFHRLKYHSTTDTTG